MLRLPEEIADSETIIRVVKGGGLHLSPQGNLKPQLLESPANKDEVSVLRLDYTTSSFCKKWGKERVAAEQFPYVGLAAFHASSVRSISSDIVASPRGDCVAHADIKHGYVRPRPQEVGTPAEVHALRNRIKDLLRQVRYYPDPDIGRSEWTGRDLSPP